MLYNTHRSSYVAVEQRVTCSYTTTYEDAFHFLRARTKRWQANLSAKKVTLILTATVGNNGDMSQRVAFSARRVQEVGAPLLTLTFTLRFLLADAISPSFYPFFNKLGMYRHAVRMKFSKIILIRSGG